LLIIATQTWLADLRPKSWREGPIVDPGVFIITQIKECRNRMGYCILGSSCSVDSDFVADDLGGHCDRLSEAFNPKASFVCCKQNPANFEEGDENLEAVILEANVGHESALASTISEEEKKSTTLLPQHSTSVATEMITELHTQTETVTKVEEVTKVITQNETEINMINTDETFLESPVQDEVNVNIPDRLSATAESQENSNQMDEFVLHTVTGPWIDVTNTETIYETEEGTPTWGDLLVL